MDIKADSSIQRTHSLNARANARANGALAGLAFGLALGVLVAGPHFEEWGVGKALLMIVGFGLGGGVIGGAFMAVLVGTLKSGDSGEVLPGKGNGGDCASDSAFGDADC